MDNAKISKTLQEMAAEQPAAHPYTLALLLETRTGVRISGAQHRPRSCSMCPQGPRGDVSQVTAALAVAAMEWHSPHMECRHVVRSGRC